jgi:hypothetical protein
MKNSTFWDITPCSLLKVNRRFGGTCRFNRQGERISRARNKSEIGSSQLSMDCTAVRSSKFTFSTVSQVLMCC